MMRALVLTATICASVALAGPGRAPRVNPQPKPPPAFALLPGGPAHSLRCTGELSGSYGETLTLTRASSAYCNDGDSLVLLGEGEPRVEATGLLVEAAATNILLRSEEFGTTWVEGTVTVADNTTVSPSGTTTGDTVTVNSDGNTRSLKQDITATASRYTLSCYIQGTGTATSADLGILQSTFVSQTGAVLDGPGSISGTALQTLTGLSASEWTRFSVTTDGALSAAAASVFIYPSGSLTQVTGDAVVLWGCQLETGTRATSYIPTAGTQETRAADAPSTAKPAALTDAAGCIAATFVASGAHSSDARIIGMTAGARLSITGTTFITASDGSTTESIAVADFTDRPVRAILRWSGSTYTVEAEGSTNSGTYDGAMLSDPLGLGATGGGAAQLGGTISDVVFGSSPEACQ